LALTSLRDMLGTRVAPEDAGGDFRPEAHALGTVTGRLHVAMADAFGTTEADTEAWLEGFRAQLARVPAGEVSVGGETVALRSLIDTEAVEATLRELLAVEDPGPAFRVHGDLHLGQFLLADAGWFVLDFEGSRPARRASGPSCPRRCGTWPAWSGRSTTRRASRWPTGAATWTSSWSTWPPPGRPGPSRRSSTATAASRASSSSSQPAIGTRRTWCGPLPGTMRSTRCSTRSAT